MNAARAFMRREHYQPPQTPADSPFRRFMVACLKCGSFKLKVIGEFDSNAGELEVVFRDEIAEPLIRFALAAGQRRAEARYCAFFRPARMFHERGPPR